MFSVPLTAGDIYIWKDKNGVENITTTPPPENAKVRHRESFHPTVENSTSDENNSSSPNTTNRLRELNELNKKKDKELSCMRLHRESVDLHNEIIRLINIEQDLNAKYCDIRRDAVKNNLSQSEGYERTKYVRDEMNEVDIKKKLLREKLAKIKREKQINNCE